MKLERRSNSIVFEHRNFQIASLSSLLPFNNVLGSQLTSESTTSSISNLFFLFHLLAFSLLLFIQFRPSVDKQLVN